MWQTIALIWVAIVALVGCGLAANSHDRELKDAYLCALSRARQRVSTEPPVTDACTAMEIRIFGSTMQ